MPAAPRLVVLPVLRFALPLGVLAGLFVVTAHPAMAQPEAPRYEVLAVNVEGASEDMAPYALQASGLRVGQRVALPYDAAFSEAVRDLYALGQFSDVEVVADRVAGEGVFLLIRVVEEPRLADYRLEGVSGSAREDLEPQIPLMRGRPVRPSDIERTVLGIQEYYRKKGYLRPTVEVERATNAEGRVELTFDVTRGPRLEVIDVRFTGNEAFSERTLRRRLKNTPERRWWRFWSAETFVEEELDEDLQRVVEFYNNRGYYGARVVRDTAYVVDPPDGRAGVVVEVAVEEGPRYRVRHVDFEGNTLFTDEQLRQALGFQRGDVYDASKLDQNLYYTEQHTDVASLYTDRGYLRFEIRPVITEVPGDSLDLLFEIVEGDVYEFGQVEIAGNTRTKDHVIRRELRTVPGQTYSRQAIERSVRELLALNYFDQASLARGPASRIDEETKTVDLTYDLEEASSDQLELSGGWGGALGLQLQAGVTFSNFSLQNLFNRSAWRPLPTGDGQRLSLSVVTAGTRYQNVSVSFTEPWFRGRQTPAGFSVGYSNFQSGESRAGSAYGRLFYRQRLRWPDDYFQLGTDVGYRLYDLSGETIAERYGLPEGESQELTFTETLSRNSLDSPIFPSNGSSLALTVTVAPPIGDFIQYHKWELTNAWYAPVTGRLTFNVATRFGYIGSLTGDDVQFQRYLVGGTPLDVQGSFRGVGTDLVFMRGYPTEAISPRQDGRAVGGRILNKYATELQLLAVQSAQLSFAPYLFFDAANTWSGFADYNPAQLYRSAGVGARIFLPILGLLDLNYGYQLDPFVGRDGAVVPPQWRFQFSLGGAR